MNSEQSCIFTTARGGCQGTLGTRPQPQSGAGAEALETIDGTSGWDLDGTGRGITGPTSLTERAQHELLTSNGAPDPHHARARALPSFRSGQEGFPRTAKQSPSLVPIQQFWCQSNNSTCDTQVSTCTHLRTSRDGAPVMTTGQEAIRTPDDGEEDELEALLNQASSCDVTLRCCGRCWPGWRCQRPADNPLP